MLRLLFLFPVVLLACSPAAPGGSEEIPRPVLETRADSVAWRIYEASGGPAVWTQVPYVRFNFGGAPDTATTRPPARRHLWNRQTGDYRLEIPRGDTLYTALFNINTREGQVYRDGTALDSTANQAWLERAYRSFINDTYWLLVPTKVFDEGVTRAYVADSSSADRDVITLSFARVGLTPGDRYWLYANPDTGMLEAWGYVLEGNPDASPSFIERTEVQTIETPYGTARLATAHRTGPNRKLYTDAVALPAAVPENVFTDPSVAIE